MTVSKNAFGLWASPPREPGPVPSWIAPRKERVSSRSPLRPPSVSPTSSRRPSSDRSISQRPSSPPPDLMANAELRAPRTPTIPPPVIAEKCETCEGHVDEMDMMRAALAASEARVQSMRRTVLLECESELVKLALAVAERVVGRELATDPALVAAWAREAIAALEGSENVVLAAAPDVVRRLETEALGAPLVVDETLPAGTCEARGEPGRASASARDRLEAVAEALGVDSE